MKKNSKIKIILTLFGIFLVNSNIFYSLFNIVPVDNNGNLENDNEVPLKKAGHWDLTAFPVIINDTDPSCNWSKTAAENAWCSGSGTWGDPYVIENVTINGYYSSSCITIINSSVYFRIKSCILYDLGREPPYNNGGIKLHNASNGQLINNSCLNDYVGIYLDKNCDNNTISGNTANDNVVGIFLSESDDNTISGSILNDNGQSGIYLVGSDGNIIVGNTASNINYAIWISGSDDNIIVGNTASNNYLGIWIDGSDDNIISGNAVDDSNSGIYVQFSDNNIISGNTVDNAYYGIHLYASNNSIIRSNLLVDNTECIVEQNCENNIFESNSCTTTIKYLFVEILDQTFTKEVFNISFYLGQGIEGATIQMWWNGINVSSSIFEIGNGVYNVSLTPIFVLSDENPILLNMSISAAGYYDTYFESYIAVELYLLNIDILDQLFTKEVFNITFYVYNGTGQGIEGATILIWWDGTFVTSSIVEIGNGVYKVSLVPIFVSPGDEPKLLKITVSAIDYESIDYELELAVDPAAVEKLPFEMIIIIIIIVGSSAGTAVIIIVVLKKKGILKRATEVV